MSKVIKDCLKWDHDPARKGIFVQRTWNPKTRTDSKFCVTFPRLANLKKEWEGEVVYPSGAFDTFGQAYAYALNWRDRDTRMRECPIYLLEQRWEPRNRSVGRREVQRIG